MTEHAIDKTGSQEREFLGHPIGLIICFLTEMWERFSYYGMRTILVLYLVKYHLFATDKANMIYGAYAGLVYMMPILGGYLADRYLGSKKAVTYGAILLVLGHFLMGFHGPRAEKFITLDGTEYQVAFEKGQITEKVKQGNEIVEKTKDVEFEIVTVAGVKYQLDNIREKVKQDDGSEKEQTVAMKLTANDVVKRYDNGSYELRVKQNTAYLDVFFLSLALIITGVGFLKANISTIVGALYGPKDARKDGGFSIFYMGINLGSLLSTGLVGYVGETYGWNYGFGLAGFGMLLGLVVFLWGQHLLEGRAEPKNPAILKEKSPIGLNKEWTIYLFGIGLVGVSWIMMQYQEFVGNALGVAGLIMLSLLVFYGFKNCEKDARNKLFVASFLIAIQSVFWALFEQQAASLTLLADQQFNLSFLFIDFKASQVQILNPLFVVIFAPVLAWLWVKLNKNGIEPSTPSKFALAMLIIGLGCVVFAYGLGIDEGSSKSFMWMIVIYLSFSLAELCLSPVGLSMVTKLSPQKIVGMVMGTWFLFTALGNYWAGAISALTGSGSHGADAGLLDVSATMSIYYNMGYLSMAVGVVIFVMTPLLKKGMHGVH